MEGFDEPRRAKRSRLRTNRTPIRNAFFLYYPNANKAYHSVSLFGTGMIAKKSIPERLWKSILANMPIPCVDVIVYTRVLREACVLLGYRKIYPYNDKWALPGGRIVKKESLHATANRQLMEIGIRSRGGYELVGVYPVNFKRRSDISICLSTRLRSPQEPRPTREMARSMHAAKKESMADRR